MTTILPTPRSWPAILLPRGVRDPLDLAAAREAGAFVGLARALHDLGPTGTIATVAASGLRGRGGAGFPTAEKWRTAAAADAATAPDAKAAIRRFVVANGYGADPSSQTDRTLLEQNPYAVLEGAVIAATAIGAGEAIIAVRAEAVEVIRGLETALERMLEANLAGDDILGSGRSVEISIRAVQGAYMLGEETVLLKAIEGRRGQPEQRPPQPATRGLFGSPTVVQNVQTLASVPWILANGAEAFAAIGSKGSPGTILVSLRAPGGDGVAEVPIGTPLREIVAIVDKGATNDLKAILVGGPAGGILPPELADTAYEFEALRAVGAHIGSGSVVAADQRACIVDLARLLTRFCADEACGKTIPCRIGLRRVSEIGDRIATGLPKPTDLQLLADLSSDIVGSGLCDHERLATLPFMTGMQYFKAELDEHILRSSCPAGVCRPIAVAAGATH
ncbi:MAG TPA: NADH-ubiquinone oxidoreductase-F iron-sulfur binding region domain-containing protein [Candidatus Limnocylindrales bacterium]|nr:NADH-ubiquinone oxidoreductase-F iron-sulfur binding region domain-containing protein [Candidatus Limnocylindrales bacterium]